MNRTKKARLEAGPFKRQTLKWRYRFATLARLHLADKAFNYKSNLTLQHQAHSHIHCEGEHWGISS